MKVPTVYNCCCGCSLRTGTLIIGNLWALGSFIVLITYSVAADQLADLIDAGSEDYARGIQGMLILTAIVSAVEFLLALCLIYGTVKDIPTLIFPWLATYSVIAIINAISYLAAAIIYFAAFMPGSGIGVLIGGCVNLGLMVYCLIVVNSHYLILTGVGIGAQPNLQYP